MLSKVATTVVALATAHMVSAQTFTACNPMEKKCPDNEAFGSDIVSIDFTKGLGDNFDEAEGTTIKSDSKGAIFTIEKESNAPTVSSNKYLFFGHIDVEIQAAPGTGIVTSFVLQSDNLDEIDWEWLGGDETQVQTNYFGKGDTTTYDRGSYEDVANPQSTVHKYSIDWTKDHVQWFIDDNMVRELKYADAQGGSRFPQTPAQIKLGTWVAGGKNSPKGTVEWAGGYTDFAQAPFNAYYKSITIQDYSNGVKNAEKYVWEDGSDGSYQSINVITEDGASNDEGDDDSTETTSSVSSATPKSTPAASGSASASVNGSASASASSSASASASSAQTTLATATKSEPITQATGIAGSVDPEEESSTPSTPSGSSPAAGSKPIASSPIPQAGALKTGFSGVVLCAGLFAALML